MSLRWFSAIFSCNPNCSQEEALDSTKTTAEDQSEAAPAPAPSAASDADKLAKRVERFGRIAPVTETEMAEKMAKRRAKFGLPEQVIYVNFSTVIYEKCL